MAMRSRGGGGGGGGGSGAGARRGTRAGVVRSVYEDFKPLSEWQQDDESHVLNIYLPGFMKEQVRITTEGRNSIRVRGERLVAGNKWSRFLEDYQVPENGEMNSVHAKFQGGILRVTVTKEGVGKPQDALPPESRDVDEIRKQPTPQKGGLDKPFPQAGTSQSTEEKSLEPVKASPEPNNERDHRGMTEVSQGADVTKEKVHKETMGGSEAETTKTKESEKTGIPEKKQQNYNKAVKGLTELNEERQLLVNMGVAMLVIMALTAYVTHSFASAKHKN